MPFKVDRERRQMLCMKLQRMFDAWTPPELPPEITEAARALLDTEGNDAPPGGWGNLPEPDMPPEEFLLWPEGAPVVLKGLRGPPGLGDRGFPAEVPKRAPSADINAEPPWPVAERIQGEIYIEPRPALRQAMASSLLGGLLVSAFQLGAGGPGGWIILDNPEIHFGEDVLVPDVAGWRAERAPKPGDDPFTTIAPDWVCEILSPSTLVKDLAEKTPVYARSSVRYAWTLDLFAKVLTILELDRYQRWTVTACYNAFTRSPGIRAAPFDEIEINLAMLWGE
jgi:Uma2 family endonuclease